MGQTPSSAYEPFIVDLETVKVTERLVALPICEATFGDINSPIFRQFYAVRCDDSVRHWYCSPPSRDTINPPPPMEFIYQKFVREATSYIQYCLRNRQAEWTPIPIVLLKLGDVWNQAGQRGVPTVADLRQGVGCEIVGYFGCRHFSAVPEACDPYGVLGLFLSKAYHNEAKSVAILEVACRCFAEASLRAGHTQPQWPAEVRFSTLSKNLPCLRLIQKLMSAMGANYLEAWRSDIHMETDEAEQRFRVVLKGGAIRSCADALAAHVGDGFVLRAKSVDPAPSQPLHPVLDAAVVAAKSKWMDSNRVVHEPSANRASVSGTSTESNASSEPTTPRKVEISHPATNTHPQGPHPGLPAVGTYYTNDPYCMRLGKPVLGTPIGRSAPVNDYGLGVAPKLHANPHLQPMAPVPREALQSSGADPQRPLSLFLPKRTSISFWKKGVWLTALWRREERLVKLASVQHALDSGLLCLEAVGDNELDIAIFDEWSRPAHLRLEQRCFYAPVQCVFRIDPATEYVSPLLLDPHYQSIVSASTPTSVYRRPRY